MVRAGHTSPRERDVRAENARQATLAEHARARVFVAERPEVFNGGVERPANPTIHCPVASLRVFPQNSGHAADALTGGALQK